MSKALKILRIAAVAVLVLILVLMIALNIYGGRIAKWGIETAGSKTLGVPVTVNNVSLSVLGGKLSLKDLVIDNPPDYQNKKLLELGSGKVAVSPGSLLSDVIKVKEISLADVNVVLEQKGLKSNNIQDIMKNIPKGEQEAQAAQEGGGKKLKIDLVELKNIRVKVKLLPIPGKDDTIPLVIPSITMTDLGSELTTSQLISKILVAITNGIAEQGAGILPPDMLDGLNNQLKELRNLTEGLLKDGAGLGTDILKKGTDAGKDITEGLKGILKPKKE